MQRLESRQFKAIRRSSTLGLEIQKRFPEVADDYKKGNTLREIVDKYGIVFKYDIPLRVAIGAVNFAIRGHSGGFGVLPYNGLIRDESELEILCKSHRIKALGSSGHDNLSKYGRMGGKIGGLIGGATNRKEKTGICGMTREQARKAGLKSAETRGYFISSVNFITPTNGTVVRPSQNLTFNITETFGSDFIDQVNLTMDGTVIGLNEYIVNNWTGTYSIILSKEQWCWC